MTDSLISVIVPVYCAEKYLKRCVASILEQTYENIELLLICNGEQTDKSIDICREYESKDHRVKVIVTEEKGVANARNIGVKKAGGEYIGFVDSDDWIEPDMYESLLFTLIQDDSEIAICNYYLEFQNKREVCGFGKQKIMNREEGMFYLASDRIESFTWNKLFQSRLFFEIQFPPIAIFEDVAVMHRIFDRAKKISIVSKALYHYERHKTSLISKRNYFDRIQTLEIAKDRYEYIRINYPTAVASMNIFIYNLFITMALAEVQADIHTKKKCMEYRNKITEYYQSREDQIFSDIEKRKKRILHFVWKNHFFSDLAALIGEYLGRKFSGLKGSEEESIDLG